MLVYLDTSVLVRAYLVDEPGHTDARHLLEESHVLLVSASWTRVEATSAIVRAGRVGRCDATLTLPVLDHDLSSDGPVTLLAAPQEDLEAETLAIVTEYALRSLDALHLAVARLSAAPLLSPGETLGFATRDAGQAHAASALGFRVI